MKRYLGSLMMLTVALAAACAGGNGCNTNVGAPGRMIVLRDPESSRQIYRTSNNQGIINHPCGYVISQQ